MRIGITFGILALSAATLHPSLGAAQAITVKNAFFGGPQFSTDGQGFQKVGRNANDLRDIMGGCEDCILELQSYKSDYTAGLIFGSIGGFLIGWPLGGSLAGEEWNDTYTGMMVAGGALTVVGIVFSGAAMGHLKNAANDYNTQFNLSHRDLKLEFRSRPRPGLLTIRF